MATAAKKQARQTGTTLRGKILDADTQVKRRRLARTLDEVIDEAGLVVNCEFRYDRLVTHLVRAVDEAAFEASVRDALIGGTPQ